MIEPTGEKPSFTPSPAPASEQTGRLRAIMAKVGSNLGLFKVHNSPPIDPSIVAKKDEVDQILKDLDKIRKKFGKKLNPELQEHFLSVISPMERQLKKIIGKLESGKIEESEGWLTKAKIWTELKNQPFQESTVLDHLITHVISDVHTSIRKDFEVIRIYLYDRMDTMKLTTEERENVEAKLKKPLAELGDEVRNLALIPARATLNALKDWRSEVDTKRQEHHEAALELIDRVLKRRYQ